MYSIKQNTPRTSFSFFFFNDTATTEIYTLSLHDALPIYLPSSSFGSGLATPSKNQPSIGMTKMRSEEHTSELQSQSNLVCRLLLEKKKKTPEKVLRLNEAVFISDATLSAPIRESPLYHAA